jgi:hypothetical protein
VAQRVRRGGTAACNDVWTRLDAHLANQESRKYRNRLVWFQRIAAGVLLLLLGSGAWLWMSRQTTGSQLAHETGQARTTGSEMARAGGGTATLPADAASPAGQTAGDPTERGTAGSGVGAQQTPHPGTSPEALAKARPATTGPRADEARQGSVDFAGGPALAKEKRAGTGPAQNVPRREETTVRKRTWHAADATGSRGETMPGKPPTGKILRVSPRKLWLRKKLLREKYPLPGLLTAGWRWQEYRPRGWWPGNP